MALKQLMITRKLVELKKKLEEIRQKKADFLLRRKQLEERETELETAVHEVTEETSPEDKQAVEDLVDEHEAQAQALDGEEQEADEEEKRLGAEIAKLEAELEEINKRSKAPPVPAEVAEEEPANGKRKDEGIMRRKFFGMTMEQRDAFLKREDVSSFLERVVSVAKEKRTIKGNELSVPEIMLGIIRENITEFSKLISRVNLVSVDGAARTNILGAVPEAVWTEMIAHLNELSFDIYNAEVDGFAVGGFIAIPNMLIEDSRYPALAQTIMDMLGKAIGKAIDKAIVYGRGTKMPLGFIPRLAETAKPSNYPSTARPWEDLRKNMLTVRGGTAGNYAPLEGIELFKGIIFAKTAAESKYTSGNFSWLMSENTWTQLLVAAMSINANGAIVSGMNMTMPVVGGEVILLADVVPDGELAGGYFDNYLLAERAGVSLANSEHVRFLARQTVFAGEARYDGKPIIPEAFIAIAIDGGEVTTEIPFAFDAANITEAKLTELTIGSRELVPSFSPRVQNYYLMTASASDVVTAEAEEGTVEISHGETAVTSGDTVSWNKGGNTLTITVTNGAVKRIYAVNVTRR